MYTIYLVCRWLDVDEVIKMLLFIHTYVHRSIAVSAHEQGGAWK